MARCPICARELPVGTIRVARGGGTLSPETQVLVDAAVKRGRASAAVIMRKRGRRMSCPCGLKPEFCHREYAVRVCPAFTGIPSLETHPTREALELQIFGLRRDIAHRNNLLTKAAPILRDSEGNDYLVERIEKAIR